MAGDAFAAARAADGTAPGVVVGSGAFSYRVAEGWGRLPDGWDFKDVAAVGVDRDDRVYVFNRGAHPMIVFDRAGNFLRSWGEGTFARPHGLHIAPDGNFYCTDDGDHTVRKCTPDGKVLLTIGIPGKPAPYFSGEPFHRCTHTALSPTGDIYVSDGYGNARVHKYDANGRHLMSWGEPGTDPRPVQPCPQSRRRRRRLGLCRRSRKPSRAGIRRQRQVRGAVEQPAPAVRVVHGQRGLAAVLHRRTRADAGLQSGLSQPRSTAVHHRQRRQDSRPHRAVGRRRWRLDNSSRRTDWPWTPMATSMSAKFRTPRGAPYFPIGPSPSACAPCRKLVKIV